MPKVTENIVVNASNGAAVNVTASIHCRKMTIDEDPKNGAAAGLQYALPDDNFATFKNLEVSGQLILGNTVAQADNAGPIIGTPGYSSGGATVAATVVAKLLSQGAATKYRKSEVE